MPDQQAQSVPLLQSPLTTQTGFASEQLAFVPPPEPLQLQIRVVPQAVAPLSPATVPAVQATPSLLLQAPLTTQAGLLREQLAFVPPPEPLQLQIRVVPQAVAPLSPATVPAKQPSSEQTPLTTQAGFASEQLAFVPPPEPLQLQLRVVPQAVAPLSPATVPAEQVPPEPPQTPLTSGVMTAQLIGAIWLSVPSVQERVTEPV
jgi:hypothetical protein